MRAIAKQIRFTRNGKFYRPRTGELTPACAVFFYDVYKTVSIAQATLPALIKTAALRNLIIEHYIGAEIPEKFSNFSPESIAERAKTTNPKRLAEELRGEFESLCASVDTAAGAEIDSCYSRILSLGQLVSFDYYALLKRFGFSGREHSFNTLPQFAGCKAGALITMLQDFVEYIAVLDPSQDWKTALRILKASRNGSDLIAAGQWGRLLSQFQEILHSRVLQLIIQHASENPKWKMNPQMPDGRIFSDWLESRRQVMEKEIARVASSQWVNLVGELSRGIFGNMVVNPLSYYNEKTAELFAAKGFEGFAHTEALNYLEAFLRQIFAKEVQEFCDLLIVRAQWTAVSVSVALNNVCDDIRSLAKRLDDFDSSLGGDSPNGLRLVGFLARFDRDRTQGRAIKGLLNTVDNEAMEILMEAAGFFASIAKIAESAMNDYFQNPHLLILNWREVEVASHRNMSVWIRSISTRLEKFVTLSRLLIEQ
ncbi:MAG: hypothetical protein LBI91_06555 [Spirochaetaceae bacterium]|nr:hypothetical protein [Spirochaetaceae bacterium]